MTRDELRRRLDALYAQYDERFVDADPLQFVRQQTSDADREVVGLIASSLTYGNVKQIKASIAAVLKSVSNTSVVQLSTRAFAGILSGAHRGCSRPACSLGLAQVKRIPCSAHSGAPRGRGRRGRRRLSSAAARPALYATVAHTFGSISFGPNRVLVRAAAREFTSNVRTLRTTLLTRSSVGCPVQVPDGGTEPE